MAVIFDGKAYATTKKEEIKQAVNKLTSEGVVPTLASIYLSSDPGSSLYTKLKKSAAESVGIKFIDFEVKEKDVGKFIEIVDELNLNGSVHGILVQKPSGEKDLSLTDWSAVVQVLDPRKDVDGLTPENLGLLSIGTPRFVPATVKAVMSVLESWSINVSGKNVVIVGASEILGKPLSMILSDKDATVSLLHSKTDDISRYTKEADILISATGVPGLIKAEMVKEEAAVIDVGAPKGDVVAEKVAEKVAFLSPVPGGVGPVTISSLLENLTQSCNSS